VLGLAEQPKFGTQLWPNGWTPRGTVDPLPFGQL
jgi:hypothetical protein